jgi:hypothetical protein
MVAIFWIVRKPEQERGCRLKSRRLIRLAQKATWSRTPHHARRLKERHPFVNFAAHELSERLRRALGIRRQIDAEFSQSLGHALLADVTFRQFYSGLMLSSFTRRA